MGVNTRHSMITRQMAEANTSRASRPSDASQTEAVKVARSDSGRVRGRRGSLKFMVKAPLDVLHEIFKELEAIDLLHLSWACKSLHTIVMSRSAEYLWRSALAKLYQSDNPPPSCPDDLNPAQYIRFLFVNKCMECGSGRGNYDSWVMRLRVCWRCLQSDRFIRESSLDAQPIFLGIRAKGDVFYHVNNHKEQEVVARYINSPAYQYWKAYRVKLRQGELQLIRKTALLKKLQSTGWREREIQTITKFNTYSLPGFDTLKKLTDKEWRSLRPKLIKRLRELQIARDELIASQRYRTPWTRIRIPDN